MDVPPQTTLPAPLKLFLRITVLATLMCALIEVFCDKVLHWGAPYNWPFTPYQEFLLDFTTYWPKFTAFHTAAFFAIEPQYPFSYPAPMALLYGLLYLISWHREDLILAFFAAVGMGGAMLLARIARRAGLSPRVAWTFTLITLVCSYPLAFEVKQGNLEIFVWLMVAAGLALFTAGRLRWATVCFFVAGALKLFPIVFLGLLVARRRWRLAFAGVVIAGLVTLSSLWLIYPDIAYTWAHLEGNMAILQQKIVLQVVPREIGFDHSLFGFIKRLFNPTSDSASLRLILRLYLPAAAVAGTLLFFLRVRYLPLVNQVLVITVAAILLPPVSYDYTLLYLYLPLAMLLPLSVREPGVPGITPVFTLLALLLAPMGELIWHGQRFGGQVKAVGLLVLLIYASCVPLAESRTATA